MLRRVAFGIAGALLIWALSLLIPDRYTSSAFIRVEIEPFPISNVVNMAYQEAVSRKSIKGLIERFNLYPGERERLPLEDVIEIAKKDVSLSFEPDHDIVVSFRYWDATATQAAATAVINDMIAASESNSQKVPGLGRLEIKQAAGASEAEPSGMAFWRKTVYVSRGTLTVRKLDTFHADIPAAKQRTEALKQMALSRESLQRLIAYQDLFHSQRGGRTAEQLLDDLREHLRIDAEVNTLKIRFTGSDARTAQATVSRFLTVLIDEYSGRPDCEPIAATVVVNHQPTVLPGSDLDRIAPDLASPDEGARVPLFSPPAARSAPLAHAIQLKGTSVPGDCRAPRLAKWEDVINILDPASLPEESDGPCRWILAIFGFFLGLGLSAALSSK